MAARPSTCSTVVAAHDLRVAYGETMVFDGLAVEVHGGDRLAMGSTTGNLWVSENAGESWDLVSSHLPPVAVVQFATA